MWIEAAVGWQGIAVVLVTAVAGWQVLAVSVLTWYHSEHDKLPQPVLPRHADTYAVPPLIGALFFAEQVFRHVALKHFCGTVCPQAVISDSFLQSSFFRHFLHLGGYHISSNWKTVVPRGTWIFWSYTHGFDIKHVLFPCFSGQMLDVFRF